MGEPLRARYRGNGERRERPVTGYESPKFHRDGAFQLALRRRVAEHFRRTGHRPRGGAAMHAKSAIFLGALAASYGLLVFAAESWWQGGLLAVILGLVAAGVGFNVQHDGGHQAYSERPWVNKLMAMTLELLGGSSYVWRWKHGRLHHAYVNVDGHDTDIDLGPLGRLSPHQRRLPYHRWQHLYLWAFYALLPVKWQLVGDFRCLVTGRIGGHPVAPPRGRELLVFVGGKVVFFTAAFAIPLTLHATWKVAACYAIAALVAGLVLSVVFQLAHCVGEVDFPPRPEMGRLTRGWAVHQVETTADFARGSRIVTWLLGGLNFQIEHHLFPRISHVNYPALAGLVEETCREFGVRYVEHRSCWAGVVSHFRWLRQMGRG